MYIVFNYLSTIFENAGANCGNGSNVVFQYIYVLMIDYWLWLSAKCKTQNVWIPKGESTDQNVVFIFLHELFRYYVII